MKEYTQGGRSSASDLPLCSVMDPYLYIQQQQDDVFMLYTLTAGYINKQ